jgi:integrase
MAEGIVVRPDRPKPYEAWAFDARTGKKLRKSFATEREAKTWRQDAQRALRLGTATAATTPRVEDAARDLLAGMRSGAIPAKGGKPFRGSTIRAYDRMLAAYIVPDLGPRRLASIRHIDLLDHIERLTARGLAPATVKHAMDPLRVILRRAYTRRRDPDQPGDRLEFPGSQVRPRDRVATPGQIAALVAALDEPVDRALWAAGFYAGLRAGELRALRWRHVDLVLGRISVEDAMDEKQDITPPKTKAGTRHVPIVPHLRRHLVTLRGDAIPRPDAFVFGDADDVAFGLKGMYGRARRNWKAAGITETFTLHEARHCCISIWAMTISNPKTIQSYAGHASIVMTLDRYGKLMPGSDDAEVARISAYLGG